MEALPATNSELAPIRSTWVRGAAGEVEYLANYAAVIHGATTGQPYAKALAESGERTKAEFQAANKQGASELGATVEALGGPAAFHGRVDAKRLEEVIATMRRQAGG